MPGSINSKGQVYVPHTVSFCSSLGKSAGTPTQFVFGEVHTLPLYNVYLAKSTGYVPADFSWSISGIIVVLTRSSSSLDVGRNSLPSPPKASDPQRLIRNSFVIGTSRYAYQKHLSGTPFTAIKGFVQVAVAAKAAGRTATAIITRASDIILNSSRCVLNGTCEKESEYLSDIEIFSLIYKRLLYCKRC